MSVVAFASEPVGGGHVHYGPSPVDHPPRDGLSHKEHPAQVHRDDPVPLSRFDVQERISTRYPGVVDQHVDAAEGPFGFGYERRDVSLLTDVGSNSGDLARAAQLLQRLREQIVFQATYENPRPLLDDTLSRRSSDAARSAGDQDALVVQTAHAAPRLVIEPAPSRRSGALRRPPQP